MHDADILQTRLPLPQLADRFGRSTSWARDLRRRDPRFPPPDAAGRYSLAAVAALLDVREAERVDDADFAAGRREMARAALSTLDPATDPNGVLADALRRAILEPCTRAEWIGDRLADLERLLATPARQPTQPPAAAGPQQENEHDHR